MIYWQLFFSFLQIGAFSFGGGYAAMPLIQSQVVELHHWLTLSEFTDLVTISQMTPGPIAINAATFVGEKVAGFSGAVMATLGCTFPSCLLVTLIAYFYIKYKHLQTLQDVLKVLRPCVIVLIAVAGLTIIMNAFFDQQSQFKTSMVIIFSICFYLLSVKKMNPIFVMILAGVLNVIHYFLFV